jgi:high-affinity K+ transport system ATPase subunit B
VASKNDMRLAALFILLLALVLAWTVAWPNIAEAWAHGRSSVTGKKESARQQGRRKRTRS